MNKLVSVIIPAFNAEKTIERCLQSICKQSYRNLQIICVNDGSTDTTLSIIKNHASYDGRIIIVDKVNEGVSVARNKGLTLAMGYYVQFIDSDDAIEENMTELLVSSLETSVTQMVVCGYQSSNGKIHKSLPSGIYFRKEVYDNFIELYRSTYLNPPWNKLYIREFIYDEFPSDMNLGEDLVFNLTYISRIEKILILAETPYIYTIENPTSLTSKYDDLSFHCLEKKIWKIIEFLPSMNYEKIRKQLAVDLTVDYKRTFKRLINCKRFTNDEAEKMIYLILHSQLWSKIISDYEVCNKEDYYLCNNKIKRYIRKITNDSRRCFLVNIFKKIIKKIIVYKFCVASEIYGIE